MSKQKTEQQGFGHIGLIAAFVLVAVVGFAGWRVMNQNDDEPQLSVDTSIKTEDVQTLPDDISDIKSLTEIQTLAGEQAAGLSIIGIELETEHNATVYVVYLSDGSKLVFDARTAERVIKSDNGTKSDNEQSIPAGFVAGISIQQAIDVAKKEHPNAKVRKVELESEEGIVVYSVRFTDDSRVDVSAVDGSIKRVKTENGDTTKKSNSDDDDSDADDSNDDSSDDSSADISDDQNDSDEDNHDDSGDDDNSDDNDGSNSGSGSSHND